MAETEEKGRGGYLGFAYGWDSYLGGAHGRGSLLYTTCYLHGSMHLKDHNMKRHVSASSPIGHSQVSFA